MRKKLLASGVLAFALSTSVNATLQDNETYTTDTDSGLDWFDLSQTVPDYHDAALSNNPGWRAATYDEVINLFGLVFPDYYDAAYSDADQLSDIIAYQALFGVTFDSLDGDYKRTAGYFLNADGTGLNKLDVFNHGLFSAGCIGVGCTSVNLHLGNVSLTDDGTENDHETGSFLVRDTVAASVPEPSILALLLTGVIGIVGISRRKVNI